MNLFELFPSASVDDLVLYFNESLVRATIPENKSILWYAIKGFRKPHPDSAWLLLLHNFVTKHDIEPLVENVHILPDFPEEGFYNFRGTVVLTTRRAHRQNCKGVCKRTFALEVPFENVLQVPPVNASLVRKMYSPFVYYSNSKDHNWLEWCYQVFSKSERSSYDKALADINKERVIARAISKNFCLSRGFEDAAPSLWFKQHLIGRAVSPKEIIVKNEFFRQEAADVLTPLGLSVSEE